MFCFVVLPSRYRTCAAPGEWLNGVKVGDAQLLAGVNVHHSPHHYRAACLEVVCCVGAA